MVSSCSCCREHVNLIVPCGSGIKCFVLLVYSLFHLVSMPTEKGVWLVQILSHDIEFVPYSVYTACLHVNLI